MENRVTLELSRYCNYECRHCFINAGPKGESLTPQQVKMIIGHLPSNLGSLILTGGEPFASKPLLYTALNHLTIRPFPDLKRISIFTNGFWAKDKQSINQVIREIKNSSSLPVSLQIGSTRYHREFGSRP